MGDDEDEQKDQATRGRPCFSRTEAPIGVYNGEHAIIVYDLRPLPLWPKYWIQALNAGSASCSNLPRDMSYSVARMDRSKTWSTGAMPAARLQPCGTSKQLVSKAATSTPRIVTTASLALSILTVHDVSPNIGVLRHEGSTFRA